MRSEHEIFELITKIAETDERIRAAYLYGSKANPCIEKDMYQDFDIVFVVTETGSFISNKDWINSFGKIAFIFEGLWNQVQFNIGIKSIDFTRRYVWSILLEDGNRIDLVIEILDEAIKNYADKIYTVTLLDKDGCLSKISPPKNEPVVEKPHEDKYRACCNGFWWFLSYVAKGIARDELPFAMSSYNEFIRITLDQMVDWYIGTQTEFSVSTGKRGRFYKKYLPHEIYNLYTKTYSDGNYANLWNAIFSSCELFRITASHVAKCFGFVYDDDAENSIMNYIKKVKECVL